MAFKKGNKFGESNKGRKRPDLAERNKKGLSSSAKKKIGESRKGLKLVFRSENPCPKCQSIHVISVGCSWKCGDCKKTWIKNRQKREKKIRPDNPCPKCGSIHVNSNGRDWKCSDCNRTWRKNPKPEGWRTKNLPKPKLNNKVDEIKKLSKHMSQGQIAIKLGVSQGAISSFMNKHEIKCNSKYVWSNRDPKQQKQINEKISKSLKGNTNWRFSHEFPNKEEKKLIYFFKKWNIPFKYVGDGSYKISGKCPDFIHEDESKKMIIEYFGEFWHPFEDESIRINFFKNQGWDCLIVWGKEVGWWAKTRAYKVTYSWEHKLNTKIMRWMAGLDQ